MEQLIPVVEVEEEVKILFMLQFLQVLMIHQVEPAVQVW
tara:strand:+ start:405 stop:521 length:117 start_codon:yes stop_codon:yes gene_type:complete